MMGLNSYDYGRTEVTQNVFICQCVINVFFFSSLSFFVSSMLLMHCMKLVKNGSNDYLGILTF